MIHRSFKAGKCKTSLKLAVARIKLLKNKRETQVKQLKGELARLIESGLERTARIRVDHVMREEKTMAAYDLLETYCELIMARLPIIESQKKCPIDLKEAISSVILASQRCADLPELLDVCKQFTTKYGKEFVASALELRPDCGVNRTMVEKLTARAPDDETKMKILSAIAQEHNINWDPKPLGKKDSMPPEDFLNGSSRFETASKMPVEPHDVQLPPNPGQKFESSTDISENHVTRSSLNSQTSACTEATPYATMHSRSDLEPRASERGTNGQENGHPFSEGGSAFSLNRQNWNMEFKDATSAAQAAAESAERASMAARAAAELSSHGKITRQYSTESHKSSVYAFRNEGSRKYSGPNLQEAGIEDSVKVMRDSPKSSSCDTDPRMQNQQGDRNGQDEYPGGTESIFGGHSSNKRRSGQSVFSKSSIASIDDDTSVTGLQNADRHFEKSSKVEAINPSWQPRNPEMADSLGEVSIEKQSSQLEIESVSHQQQNKKSDCSDDSREGRFRKKSSGSALSHSCVNTNDDGFSNSDHQKYRNDDSEPSFINNDQGNKQIGTKQPGSSDHPSVVFDESSLDNDHNFDVGGKESTHESDFYFPSPSRKSPSHLLENSNTWSPMENKSEILQKKPCKESHFVHELQSPSEFSVQLTESGVPLQSDDLLPAGFDDSYGLYSNSAEEDNFRVSGRTVSSSRPVKQNVFIGSPAPAQNDRSHLSTGSSYIKNEVTRENRKPILQSSSDDSDFEEAHLERNQEIKLNVVRDSSKKYVPGDFPIAQPSPSRAKLSKNLDGFEQEPFYSPVVEEEQPLRSSRFPLPKEVKAQENSGTPEFHDITNNSEIFCYLSSESEQGLNFGILRGGLRNKGYMRPLYTRGPSGDPSFLSPTQAAEDTPTIIEQPSISSTIKTSLSSEVSDQDSDNLKMRIKAHKELSSRTSKTFFDSDSDDASEDLSRRTVGRKSYTGRRLSYRTKDSPKQSETVTPRFAVGSEVPITPKFGMGKKSPSRSSYAAEPLSKSQSRMISSGGGEDPKKLRTNVPVEQRPSKPMPQSKISVHEESSKLSQPSSTVEQSSKPLQKTVSSGSSESLNTSSLSGGSISKEDSLKRASHVHPKLPDYDTLAAHFESLRSNRR